MNCTGMKRLILTDYIDAQMPERQRALVDQHLAGCAECMDYLKRVKIAVVDPFEDLERPVPAQDVWSGIKDRIESGRAARVAPLDLLWGLFERLKGLLYIPRPALALATLVSVVFVVGIINPMALNFRSATVKAQDSDVYYGLLTDDVSEVVVIDDNDLQDSY